MPRSSILTGGLLIAFGGGCVITAITSLDEGPKGFDRTPIALGIFGVMFVVWGTLFVTHSLLDGTGALARTVRMLQPLTGRTETDIRKWLGSPQSATDTEGGEQELTWDSPGYSITLRFRNGTCSNIAREVTHPPQA